jgi:hypothetical protein
MIDNRKQNKKIVYGICLIAVICIAFIFFTSNKPIGDFGNYYYGSKLFVEGKNIDSLYKDIHWFNAQIKPYGEKHYFENYLPVPPFNLLLYAPFTFTDSHTAKIVFNLLGLIALLISLARYLKFVPGLKPHQLLVLTTMFVPLYFNFMQGQSYLFITALILEIYINYTKKRTYTIAFYAALLFQVKLFPVFILGYFLFKKEYKILVLSFLMMLTLTLITSIVAGNELIINYFTEIVPRLFKNEIIDPFYSGHQSINILLNSLFCFDEVSNPAPIVNVPLIALAIESVLASVIIYIAYYTVKAKESFLAYSLFIYFGLLLNKYITNYALIMLLPFALTSFKFKKSKVVLLLLFLICAAPVNYFSGLILPIKYIRIILMLLLFVLLLTELKPKINYGISGIILLFLLALNISFTEKHPNNYFLAGNEKGIPYDFIINESNLLLSKCLGDTDVLQSLPLNFIVVSSRQMNNEEVKKYHLKVKRENISKVYLLNDSLVIYLSDLRQGVGMNKLRAVTVKKAQN